MRRKATGDAELWRRVYELKRLRPPKLRYDIPEGAKTIPPNGHGRIYSATYLREHYATASDEEGRRLFVAWGRYRMRPPKKSRDRLLDGEHSSKRMYRRYWFSEP